MDLTDTPRITKPMAKAAEDHADSNPSKEAGGVFFFPAPDTFLDPMFLPLLNRHLRPETNFQFMYNDLAFAIQDSYPRDVAVPGGTFAMFHTHPYGSGQPGKEDTDAIEEIAKKMDGHPYWRPLERHMIFSLWDRSWWWFDLETFGRVGWTWPDA